MSFQKESDMYPLVCIWLNEFLLNRYRRATIEVHDTSRKSLARLIQERGMMNLLPPEWQSWTIHVDIVGFIVASQRIELAFVECKNIPITLDHLSQILGYSRVVRPLYSFVVSPQGASNSLRTLLETYNRIDVLEYHQQPGTFSRSIVVAKWDETSNSLDNNSIITGDRNYLGTL